MSRVDAPILLVIEDDSDQVPIICRSVTTSNSFSFSRMKITYECDSACKSVTPAMQNEILKKRNSGEDGRVKNHMHADLFWEKVWYHERNWSDDNKLNFSILILVYV